MNGIAWISAIIVLLAVRDCQRARVILRQLIDRRYLSSTFTHTLLVPLFHGLRLSATVPPLLQRRE